MMAAQDTNGRSALEIVYEMGDVNMSHDGKGHYKVELKGHPEVVGAGSSYDQAAEEFLPKYQRWEEGNETA